MSGGSERASRGPAAKQCRCGAAAAVRIRYRHARERHVLGFVRYACEEHLDAVRGELAALPQVEVTGEEPLPLPEH